MNPNELAQIHVLNLCRQLTADADLDTVYDALLDVANILGAEHFMFTTFVPEGRTEGFRFYVGCPSSWIQLYQTRQWYRHDPLLRYAQNNTAPTEVSEIHPSTMQQRMYWVAAASHGFGNGFVIPAHSSGHVRLGNFFLAYRDRSRVPRAFFSELSPVLRVFAATVLDWDLSTTRAVLLQRTALTTRELEYLSMELRGMQTKEILTVSGASSPSAVNRIFASANKKLGVNDRAAAARIALDCGLIPPAPQLRSARPNGVPSSARDVPRRKVLRLVRTAESAVSNRASERLDPEPGAGSGNLEPLVGLSRKG